MRVFRRFTQSVVVNFGTLLDQLENQEAVVAATISQVEQGATRVRIHRKACERRVQSLEATIARLESEVRTWRERAARFSSERHKALECVRRALAAERERTRHKTELERQQALLRRIADDERVIQEKLAELRRRSVALSSREACASVQESVESPGDIDAVFERWEARIEGREATNEVSSISLDSFAEALTREEEEAALERELERIIEEEPSR